MLQTSSVTHPPATSSTPLALCNNTFPSFTTDLVLVIVGDVVVDGVVDVVVDGAVNGVVVGAVVDDGCVNDGGVVSMVLLTLMMMMMFLFCP